MQQLSISSESLDQADTMLFRSSTPSSSCDQPDNISAKNPRLDRPQSQASQGSGHYKIYYNNECGCKEIREDPRRAVLFNSIQQLRTEQNFPLHPMPALSLMELINEEDWDELCFMSEVHRVDKLSQILCTGMALKIHDYGYLREGDFFGTVRPKIVSQEMDAGFNRVLSAINELRADIRRMHQSTLEQFGGPVAEGMIPGKAIPPSASASTQMGSPTNPQQQVSTASNTDKESMLNSLCTEYYKQFFAN